MLGNSVVSVKEYLRGGGPGALCAPSCRVLPVADIPSVRAGLRLFRITKIALSDENISARLSSVYQTLRHLVNSCFLLIQGTGEGVALYIGLQSDQAGTAESAMKQALWGNFPGILAESLRASEITGIMGRMASGASLKTVAAVSAVPSGRKQDRQENVQGMEKYIDSMQGREFSAIILAAPCPEEAVNRRILSLQAISTALSPLEQISVQESVNRSVSLSDQSARTISESINRSISNSESYSVSAGSSQQSGIGAGTHIPAGKYGVNVSVQAGQGQNASYTSGQSSAESFGTSVGRTDMTGRALTETEGTARAVSRTEINEEIRELRKKLEKQAERLRESEAEGLWDACGYFTADRSDTAIIAAGMFQGLITGDGSGIEQSSFGLWQPSFPGSAFSNHESIRNLSEALSLGVSPAFSVNGHIKRTESIVTGRELPGMMNFPGRSAGLVAVLRMPAFGRGICLSGGKRQEEGGDSFRIGKIMHMGSTDRMPEAWIFPGKLVAHSFFTGTPGAGKTTAICGFLRGLNGKGVPFTVIEPAKGEYGELWGKLPGIEVFGTDPFRYRMLRLNPFAFGEEVHITEHMDRLISVFSTAWPLYAAQPAILRECVECAYIRLGWDLTNSVCLSGERVFPDFRSVLAELPEVIRRSHFVGEAKGTYEGALQTRLSMLTRGIFRELLCSGRDTPDRELFDGNAVIDLSRIGSQETLSLIMGLLLIRLYEHRTAEGKREGLRHVTVLEEAHNILKCGQSGPQGEDTASIASKSVEVLVKCVTELRYTGEGFIIADQSPGEVHPAAIRDTSTKVIMRLPEDKDQQAAKAALSLTPEQASGIASLERGVGAVLQEGWAEAVLVKFDRRENPFSVGENDEEYLPSVPYADLRQLRGYLLKKVLVQFNGPGYDGNALISALQGITGFSLWKLRDFRELFLQYTRNFRNMGEAFSGNRVKYPFYGKLIRDLLDAGCLLDVFPVPVPSEDMAEPYSEDPVFREECLLWRQKTEKVLSRYADGIGEEERHTVLRLLLLADGEARRERVLVCSVLSSGKERKS